MTPDWLLFTYAAALLFAVSVVALYSERRRRWFGPRPSDDRVFRCVECGYVYTDDPDVDRSRCQQCGTLNEAIKF
jgi:predicted Zn-ribbon and HTH transcriptional regulator